ERIRLLIIDDIAETRENLRKLLSFDVNIEVVGAAASGIEGIQLAKELHPHVVLMDINMPDMDGITATEIILKEVPTTEVVMLSVQGETDYLRRAMLAGARDYLTKPPSGDELMSTIHRVYQMGQARAVTMMPAHPVQSTPAPVETRAGGRDGKIVAVYSPKGGVGCTSVAVNLAVALQQAVGADKKVALVDTNLQFGDVGVMMNLPAGRSIIDLVSQIDEIDPDMLSTALSPHGSGVKVLLAPPHPEAAESLLTIPSDEQGNGNSALSIIFDMICDTFDYVVVDMWSRVDDITLTVFDRATLIVLVIRPDIPSIKNARLFLEVSGKLNYPLEKMALVVNGVDRRLGIRMDQIEQAMMPIAVQIPLDDQAALGAANHGVPFVMRDRSRPISQAIGKLAEYVQDVVRREESAQEEGAHTASAGSVRPRLARIFGQGG
ncbi:MAG: MinD/ParA family protein, partial [Chloroflexi bacterium]|nr:MinD/ParA family protein [Chloroflexota bacterium]